MKAILVGIVVFSVIFFVTGHVLAQGGQQLAGVELQAMADTFQYSLESNKTNESSDWVNPDTARSGAVIPTRTFSGHQGQPCREFITTIIIAGQEEQGFGTACRQPDGSWVLENDVNSTTPDPIATQMTTSTYLDRSPEAYYVYPSGFFGRHNIYLSFGHVYRSGRLHRGSRYLDGRKFRSRNSFEVSRRVNVGSPILFRYRLHDELNYRDWDRRSRVKHKKERIHDVLDYHDSDRDHRKKHRKEKNHD